MSGDALAEVEGRPVASVKTSKPWVALTFDDGPDEQNVPKLLALFEAEGVKATFFVVGQNVEKHPEMTRRIFEAGHEIGNHSWTHPNLPQCADVDEVRQELVRTQAVVKQVIGEEPALFRAPFLAHDEKVWTVLGELGLPSINASERTPTDDWNSSTSMEHIIEGATAEAGAGDIILMHSWRNETVEAMPEIIRRLKAKGLQMVTVSTLLAAGEE